MNQRTSPDEIPRKHWCGSLLGLNIRRLNGRRHGLGKPVDVGKREAEQPQRLAREGRLDRRRQLMKVVKTWIGRGLPAMVMIMKEKECNLLFFSELVD
ncbi:MAG: hypothetical protein V3U24_10245 [Candidatus Neomarinimicrobiota bacterium]